MEKYLLRIQKKHYWIVSFLLTVFSMYVMFSYEEILSTGRYVILEGDLLQQYVPFIKMLLRDIMQGENPWFSWSLSLGMNTSLCYAYYALSPFNILYAIFFFLDEAVVTAIILILKTALAASFFQLFARNVLKCEGVESIIFSIFYAMCSYNVLYNVVIISWMDAMYILPLLCIFIFDFVKKGKWKALVITYAYLFVTQFYMAYIAGIFSVVFLFLVLICSEQNSFKKNIIQIVKYGAVVLCAIGIATLVWLPALLFLMNNGQGNTEEVVLRLNILDIFKNMFWGQAQGYEGVYPYLYCGVPVLFLLPQFLINRKIKRKERYCAVFLLCVFMACMLSPGIYIFMHAFDQPNQFGFRFAFVVCFVCCMIACKQSTYLQQISWKVVTIELFLLCALYIVAFLFRNKTYDSSIVNPYIILVINVILFGIWYALYHLTKRKNVKKVSLATIIVFCVLVEVISNGYVVYKYTGSTVSETSYNVYRNSIQQGLQQIELVDEGNEFYRVRYLNEYVFNSDAWFGYHSLSDFNSAIHSDVQNAMERLGFYTCSNIIYDIGITPVTKMLFGVKYEINGISPYIMAVEVPEPNIFANENALGLGYMTEAEILRFSMEDKHVFDNMDNLLSTMTGAKIDCYEPVPCEEISVRFENAVLELQNDKHCVILGNQRDKYGYIIFSIPKIKDKTAYVQFRRDLSISGANVPNLLGGYENAVYDLGNITVPYAKEMQVNGENYEVIVEIEPTDVPISYQQANFCYYNEDELIKAYDILSQNQMVIREYGNTYIDAYVTVPEERTVLFTSIPYDEGWTVYVDGVETQTYAVVGDAFLALELEPGYHDLEFEYEAPGARMGMTISGVSVGLYAGCILIEYMIKRKRKAKEGTIEPDVEDRTE